MTNLERLKAVKAALWAITADVNYVELNPSAGEYSNIRWRLKDARELLDEVIAELAVGSTRMYP